MSIVINGSESFGFRYVFHGNDNDTNMGVICYKKRRTPQTTFGARDLKFAKKKTKKKKKKKKDMNTSLVLHLKMLLLITIIRVPDFMLVPETAQSA